MNDLIERWVAGESTAAEELYRNYFGRVKAFIIRRGATITDAEDVAQEAMIAGLEGLKGGKKPDRLTGWLLGIARHVGSRRFLTGSAGLEDLEDPRRRSARSMVIRKEMGELLEKTMAAMSDNDRQMLELLHRAGLSRKEIAEKLALPLDTIQARCERAHSRLRESLARHFTTVTLAKLPRQPITLEEIQQLRPAFRQAITARHLENLPHPAAALRLALPEATYRVRLQSAYEMLKCGANADFTRAREQYRKAPQ